MKVVNDVTIDWISNAWGVKKEDALASLAFLQIPFDFAVSHRPGTRFGPHEIINALNSYSLYCADKRTSLRNLEFKDYGFPAIVNDIHESYRNIESHVDNIEKAEIPFVLGGDHSISDPVLRSVIKKHRPEVIGIIIFDAHFDSREPVKGKEHSGHWVKTLKDIVNYPTMVQLGINANIYSATYMQEAEELGIMVRTPYEMRQLGSTGLLKQIKEHLNGISKVYISVDIDVVDQAFAPATSVPNAAGLLVHEVADRLFELSSLFDVIGYDVTEVSPVYDSKSNMTSHIAAQFIMNVAAGICCHRQITP